MHCFGTKCRRNWGAHLIGTHDADHNKHIGHINQPVWIEEANGAALGEDADRDL